MSIIKEIKYLINDLNFCLSQVFWSKDGPLIIVLTRKRVENRVPDIESFCLSPSDPEYDETLSLVGVIWEL